MTNVKTLDQDQLIEKLKFLVSEEKTNVASQIVLLKEVKQRKIALEWGYPNLLEFCVQELGLSRDQAWKRSQAAGVIEREPVLLEMLNKGQTSAGALAAVSSKLTNNTAEELKSFIPGKTKREVEAFVSNLNRDGSRDDVEPTVKITLEVSLKTLEKLDRARKLLNQNKVGVSREEVLDSALEVLLDKNDPQRKAERALLRSSKKSDAVKTAPGQPIGSNKPQPTPKRYIPAATRHRIHGSAEYQCRFVSQRGKRCQENRVLQIDHIKMYCYGGGHEVKNLRLMCPSHNRFLAEENIGKTVWKSENRGDVG